MPDDVEDEEFADENEGGDGDADHTVDPDLIELHEVLEWQEAVAENGDDE